MSMGALGVDYPFYCVAKGRHWLCFFHAILRPTLISSGLVIICRPRDRERVKSAKPGRTFCRKRQRVGVRWKIVRRLPDSMPRAASRVGTLRRVPFTLGLSELAARYGGLWTRGVCLCPSWRRLLPSVKKSIPLCNLVYVSKVAF